MKSRLAIFLKSNLPAISWSGFILLLCGLPGSDFPDSSSLRFISFDKAIHVFMFSVLVFLSISGLKRQMAYKRLKYNAIMPSLCWAICVGVFSELMQGMIFRERSADLYDVVANCLGAFIGLIVFYLIYGKENTFRLS